MTFPAEDSSFHSEQNMDS